jgi:hypothetical protein
MTPLIKRKNTYRYYWQLSITAISVLLCLYVLSVSAGEQQIKTSAVYVPAKLAISSNKLNPRHADEKNLKLQAILPGKLAINDARVIWRIQRAGKTIRTLKGNQQALNLTEGMYVVHLQIGEYKSSKRVVIKKNQQLRPYFRANIGHLAMSADHPVIWQIDGPDNLHYQTKPQHAVNEVVPAGEYRVKAVLPALVQQHKISVRAGQHATHRLIMPLGKVNLMAIRNNQPLLQAMEWEVFRLEKTRRHSVGKYHLHSNSIRVPPGQYEAVARHKDKISKRRFWVQKETTSKVILVMD